jgi:subtilisin family serine protease
VSAPARPHLRGRLAVRLRSGVAEPGIQSLQDVRRGAAVPALSFGTPTVNRTFRRRVSGMLVTRYFSSAAGTGRPGAAHTDFDDLEEDLGLSRTFRVALGPDVDLGDLAANLMDLDEVELATPVYFAQAPFAAPQGPARPVARPRPDAVYAMIGADQALAMEPGDRAVLIGLVDSGVALGHPELARHLRTGVDTVALEAGAMPAGMTLLSASTSYRRTNANDDNGHGTGVASIIAAEGMAMHRGLANDALVIPAKALAAVRQQTPDGEATESAIGSLYDIDCAVKLAVDLGARVLNLSFGTPASSLGPDDPLPHEDVVRYALARGCVLVAASGNNGDVDPDDPFYPAALPGVIAVGAVGLEGHPSSFSSRGKHVALSAPGEGIPMAALSGYKVGNGTSFAAPFVTATAALMVGRALRQATPLDGEAVLRLLVASARRFQRGTDARGCGSGVLDVPAALRAVDAEVAASDEDRAASRANVTSSASSRSFQPTSPN